MKALILTAVAVASAVSAFAQGTVIFNNRISTTVLQTHVYAPLAYAPYFSQIGNGSNDYPAGPTSWAGWTTIGAAATGQYSGSATWAALLVAPGFNAAVSSMVPAATPGIVSFRTGAAGGFTMGGVAATANNVALDSPATLEMVAWDNSSGLYSTWPLALAARMSGAGNAIGWSNPFNLTLGGTATPPYLVGLQSFGLIPAPEPSTFALASLGAAALLIFRRRK
jgi:hypothetical protein